MEITVIVEDGLGTSFTAHAKSFERAIEELGAIERKMETLAAKESGADF